MAIDEFNVAKAYFHYYPKGTPAGKHPSIPATNGIPKEVNFGLSKSLETDTLKVALLGDLQMRIQEEMNYTNRLLTPELNKRDDLSLAIMLGDIADDNLNLLNATRQITKHFKMTAYAVFGNHDRNLVEAKNGSFNSTFKQIYGPDYYAVNYGKVHFIMLNDVMPTKEGYKGSLSENQLTFVEKDLKYVPDDYLIVFTQHIPLYTLENLDALLNLIKDRKHVLAVSGHRHILEQEFITYGDNQILHEVVAGAVCGLWWDGERDWKGIPVAVMGGGAPKGYYIFTFTGNQYKMIYKQWSCLLKNRSIYGPGNQTKVILACIYLKILQVMKFWQTFLRAAKKQKCLCVLMILNGSLWKNQKYKTHTLPVFYITSTTASTQPKDKLNPD